jgi:hypothetical protein
VFVPGKGTKVRVSRRHSSSGPLDLIVPHFTTSASLRPISIVTLVSHVCQQQSRSRSDLRGRPCPSVGNSRNTAISSQHDATRYGQHGVTHWG